MITIETTEGAIIKQLAVSVSSSNENLEREVDLINLEECPSGTAQILFS